jgi:hypothetical protein
MHAHADSPNIKEHNISEIRVMRRYYMQRREDYTDPTVGSVVVVNASAGATFTISGLPAGSYGMAYTTATETGVEAPAATLPAGAHLTANIPAAGVITIYRK